MAKVKFTKILVTKLVLDVAGSLTNERGQVVNYVSRKIFGLDTSNSEAYSELVVKYPEHLSSAAHSLQLGDIIDLECELIVSRDGTYASFLASDIFKNGVSLLPASVGKEVAKK